MYRLHQSIKCICGILHHKYILFQRIDPLSNKLPGLIYQHLHVFAEPGLGVELHALLELAFKAEDWFGGVSVATMIQVGVGLVDKEVVKALLTEFALSMGLHFWTIKIMYFLWLA